MDIEIDENLISVREDVQGACEILGFDPLYVANKRRFVAFIPKKDGDKPTDRALAQIVVEDDWQCFACVLRYAL